MEGDIINYTNEELINELTRRMKQDSIISIPKMNAYPDYSRIKEISREYLTYIAANKCDEDHYIEVIYECIMETLYGYNIFNWINKKLNDN